MRIVNVGMDVSAAETGMKPEKTPVIFEWREIGSHGLSKLDCVTVWLAGINWNCTISPLAAIMLLGE